MDVVYRHFGRSTLRTQDTLDLLKFGPRALWHDRSVPKCPDTLVMVLKCLTDTWALESLSTYIEDQSHSILCKGLPVNRREYNFKFNSSSLYRAALSLGGELQSLVFTMSGCSAPCSIASGWAEITKCAWLQTDYRPTRERRPVIQQEMSRDQTSTLTTIIIAFEVAARRAMPPDQSHARQE